MDRYPKRLIEVDLPIRRISEHARREKSIRHGHISTLHIWWARRPLAACRAVLCASLWPDPADELCPIEFIETAKNLMINWAKNHLKLASNESSKRFVAISKDTSVLDDKVELRKALLDFIADFAKWNNSTVKEYLVNSRTLTQSAHNALGGMPGTKSIVVDPFAGGGSIPIEALRIGTEIFASDINPVAVLINKILLEYIPKFGDQLVDNVKKWGEWIRIEAEKELVNIYPVDNDGAVPIAYIWARKIRCEGPDCGAEFPLVRSFWLAKKGNNLIALKMIAKPEEKKVNFQILKNEETIHVSQGTVRRGSATCPICDYTTSVNAVRQQLKLQKGGANNAMLLSVVRTFPDKKGRFYRLPQSHDYDAVKKAKEKLEKLTNELNYNLIPDEELSGKAAEINIYGIIQFRDLFTNRQLLATLTLIRLLRSLEKRLSKDKSYNSQINIAILTCLAMAIDKQIDSNSSLCAWRSTSQDIGHTFGRQALPMVWDFVEGNILSGSTRDWENAVKGILKTLSCLDDQIESGHAQIASATSNPIPDKSVSCFFTDPPYYDAIKYADLSDFFYVWLKRTIGHLYPAFFKTNVTNKDEECIVNEYTGKSRKFFEHQMTKSMFENCRILSPDGIGVVVFAHKSTSGWEALLKSMIDADLIITSSWSIDTEMSSRINAAGTASLASSIHLVCRPRENSLSTLRSDNIGDWRDVLSELPKRIHEWLPRLANEGIVGADAIFACLGPALEIFSRYSSVEKASGEKVELKEYLEHVWSAVSREALSMIFEGADASGFEEDSRLTAMWLWTLRTSTQNGSKAEEDNGKTKSLTGYSLEYDAARKIAQGLGAHLETLGHLVQTKGDTATLLAAGSRAKYLFGKDAEDAPKKKSKKKVKQMTLFEELEELEEESEDWFGEFKGQPGKTILDQLHQSMILFGAGRGEALKRFLVEEGVGRNALFWRLAQSLSALYPSGTEEKRWVDGVLARKKGLGL